MNNFKINTPPPPVANVKGGIKKLLNFIKSGFEFNNNLENFGGFKLRVALLILYLWPVLLFSYILTFHENFRIRRVLSYLASGSANILLILLLICPVIIKFIQKISIKRDDILLSQDNKFFIKTFIVSLIVFLIYYLACYPGGFSPDSIDQIQQALNNNYSDWHPALHTLLAFTLPLKSTGGWMGSIILLQVIIFSLALACMTSAILKYSNYNYACLSLAFVLITPVTPIIAMYPWKDIAFAIASTFLMSFALHIYYTDGEWLNNFRNIILFAVMLTFATIFRHNAVLFTVPLFFAVMLYSNRKKSVIILLLISALLFAFIKFPVYKYFNVERLGYSKTELLGLPMTVIGNAIKQTPELLDQDILDFAYKVAPKDKWHDIYITGSFNHIKFSGIDASVIEKTGAIKILNMMLRCFVQSPIASLKGFISLTNLVIGVSGYTSNLIIVEANQSWLKFINIILIKLNTLMQLILSPWLGCIGFINLIILACIIAKFKLNKDCFRKIFCALPLLIYNFGTMLLLSGEDFRFFYYTFTIAPALILILLNDRINKN